MFLPFEPAQRGREESCLSLGAAFVPHAVVSQLGPVRQGAQAGEGRAGNLSPRAPVQGSAAARRP